MRFPEIYKIKIKKIRSVFLFTTTMNFVLPDASQRAIVCRDVRCTY